MSSGKSAIQKNIAEYRVSELGLLDRVIRKGLSKEVAFEQSKGTGYETIWGR